MSKKLLTTVIILAATALLLGVLVFVKSSQFKAMEEAGAMMQPPPETVTTGEVQALQWEEFLFSVGTVAPVQGVMVTPEVAGQVVEIRFESGQEVKAGDVLVRLEDSTEAARVESMRAALELAEINLRRSRELRQNNTIPQSSLDNAEATAKGARAELRNAEAELAKRTIKAPFDGVLGLRQVNLGEYLGPGSPIVPIQNLSRVYIDFSLPQKNVPRIALGQAVRATADALPDGGMDGQLTSRNSELDPRTRSLRLRSEFENPDGHLLPGMFVDVSLVLESQRAVLAIPQTAVLFAPYGDSVFVLVDEPPQAKGGGEDAKPEGNGESGEGTPQEGAAGAPKAGQGPPAFAHEGPFVEQRFIRLGETRGDFVEVIEGLGEGDTVVTSGAFKLSNGSAVTVDNSRALEFSTDPRPDNA